MSYFLCLAVPQAATDHMRLAFDRRIHLTEAHDLPIGKATRGKNNNWATYLLQVGSSSASLLCKGVIRRTHNNDHSEVLLSGIQALLKNENVPSLSFLVHWMHGYITTEEIPVKTEKHVGLPDLPHILLDTEEDVRYTVST